MNPKGGKGERCPWTTAVMIQFRFRISLDGIVQNPTKKISSSGANNPWNVGISPKRIVRQPTEISRFTEDLQVPTIPSLHLRASSPKNPRCLQPIFRPFCTHQRDESEGPRHASWRRWRRRWRLASLPSAAFGAHWASAREEGKGHVEAGGRGVSSKKLGLSFVGKSMKGRFFIRFVWGFLVQI